MGCGQGKIGADATGGALAPGTPVPNSPAGTPSNSTPGTPVRSSRIKVSRPNSNIQRVKSADSNNSKTISLVKRDTWTGSTDSFESGDKSRGTSASSKFSHHSQDSGFGDGNGQRIITENSDPDRIREIEEGFVEPNNLDDMALVGKGVTQRISAKEKTRQEEKRVMDDLRKEGLIVSRPISRAGKGVAFELVQDNFPKGSGGGLSLPPLLPPPARLAKLEKRKKKKKRLTEEQIKEKLEIAEARRKELEAKRLEKIAQVAKKSDTQLALDAFAESQKVKVDEVKSKEEIAAENRFKTYRKGKTTS